VRLTLASLLAPPLCWGCRGPAGRPGPLCRGCSGELTRLAPELTAASGVAAFAAVSYEGPARELVRALKFRAALGVAPAMAAAMVAGAPGGLLAAGAALVPVPLHSRRARWRGFNQAEVLARAVAHRTGLPVEPVLHRGGGSESQVGRDRGERARALQGSVGVRHGVRPPPRAVLVDDVITTGATLAGCAAALRAAGCRQVLAVAYARTPGR
jgi:ComF family protein